MSLRLGVLVSLALWFAATAAPAQERCDALIPSSARDVEQSFEGQIEGKIKGLIGKLAGGKAQIEGIYNHISRDTLKEYDNNDRIYIWQRIIYYACINPDADIDMNRLLELYLSGPPSIDNKNEKRGAFNSEFELSFYGFDNQNSSRIGFIHGDMAIGAEIYDLVFLFINNSKINVDFVDTNSSCQFKDLKLPRVVEYVDFERNKKHLYGLLGEATLDARGPDVLNIPPGEERHVSFRWTGSLDQPSFSLRKRKKSTCTFAFNIGNDVVVRSVDLPSMGKYIDE